MIKKAILAAVVALLLGMFFFGRDMASYVHTSAGYVKESVTDSVPIEFQIERARGMIKDLAPEIRKNMHVIAKEEVELEQLERRIEALRGKLTKDKEDLERLSTDLKTPDKAFHYAGRTYTAGQVKVDLANRFGRYKTADATLANFQETRDARQRSLEAARQKLEGMMAAKRQLEVDVENLEAQLEMLVAAQTTSDYSFDDSKLGRAKELIADLRRRLEVNMRMLDAEGYFHDAIPLDEGAPEDIVDQVTEYFSHEEPVAQTLAQD